MIVHKSYRLELDPNNLQRVALCRAVGARRFAYNWALAQIKSRAVKPDQFALINAWNQWKHTGAPWWEEFSKFCFEEAFKDCVCAFKNFFRDPKKVKYPGFARKYARDRCRFRQRVGLKKRHIRIPKIGALRYKNKKLTLPVGAKLLSAAIRRVVDRWEVSVLTEQSISDPQSNNGPVVGIDLGLTTFATVGSQSVEVERIEAPKPLKRFLKVLRKRQRALSRSVKGSNRRRKRVLAVARCHRRIANIRKDFLHKTSTRLAKTKSAIVVEDLAVSNMLRNPKLSRSISDAGWGTFRTLLRYKCRWYGSDLRQVDRFHPSSQVCCKCGHRQPMPLSVRVYDCPKCGPMDRDDNAAVGLARCYEKLKQEEQSLPPGRGKFTPGESLEHQGDSLNLEVVGSFLTALN